MDKMLSIQAKPYKRRGTIKNALALNAFHPHPNPVDERLGVVGYASPLAGQQSSVIAFSVYEGNARRFGEMAYPGKEIEVYAVTVCVRSLVTDSDQMGNVRMWNDEMGGLKNTLANSLVFGHGAQIKGAVEPRYLQPVSLMVVPDDEDGLGMRG